MMFLKYVVKYLAEDKAEKIGLVCIIISGTALTIMQVFLEVKVTSFIMEILFYLFFYGGQIMIGLAATICVALAYLKTFRLIREIKAMK